ncbi:transposase [Candidatus Gottesmanbacteria bacterium]|nr:transposase [Candidatus Gottesmanbacteria bacterium]
MASKNSVKIYVPNSYYHLYNRGVEKRKIFLDQQDYSVFLSYLETYLSPKEKQRLHEIILSSQSSLMEKDNAIKLLRLKNYYPDVSLLCYALLPNHFHLLIKQEKPLINSFMNSLGTRYAMYFNRKYKRKGVLFQDVYKAVLVETDEQLLHLSRYIHLNPINAQGISIDRWEEALFPSSLSDYLGKRQTNWIAKNQILNYFSKTNPKFNYQNFLGLSIDVDQISDIAIDLDEE